MSRNQPTVRVAREFRRIDRDHRPENVHEAIVRLQVALSAIAEAQQALALERAEQEDASDHLRVVASWLRAAVNAIVGGEA